jgi:hypothetical protein
LLHGNTGRPRSHRAAPGLKLVVDTCVGNDRPREITGGQSLATPFLRHLGEAGWLLLDLRGQAVDAALSTMKLRGVSPLTTTDGIVNTAAEIPCASHPPVPGRRARRGGHGEMRGRQP